MKKMIHFFAILLAAAFAVASFVSCSSNSDDDDDDSVSTPSAYLPAEYASKTVAALYTWSITDSGTSNGVSVTVSSTDAYYFFTDGSFVETDSWVAKANGRTQSEKEIMEKGNFTLASGDYTNGELSLTNVKYYEDETWVDGQTQTITVSKGSFRGGTYTTLNREDTDMIFTLQ